MTRKGKIALLLAIVVLALAVLACGDGDLVDREIQYVEDIAEDLPGTWEQVKEDAVSPWESLQDTPVQNELCGPGDALCIGKLIESLSERE